METGDPVLARQLLVRALVATGVAVAISTEALGAFGLLRPLPLALVWGTIAAVLVWRMQHIRIKRPGFLDSALITGVVAILVVVGVTAWLSPPNSADAMAYHLPRVVYWAQSGSVAFFPTPYFNQITLSPLAEYFMLHTYVLSGGDRYVNFVQLLGFLGSIVTVSLIARELGAGVRGQVLASVFCATLPNAILQASGAKNDCLLSLWLAVMVYFALRREIRWMALSLGLALATKATAFLFAPPMLLVTLPRRHWVRALPAVAAGVLLINGPQYGRNFALSGSVLGYDSAQDDGLFRWRNEPPGAGATVSNVLRNVSVHLGARSESWNQGVYQAVIRAHSALGLNPDDPRTTWRWERLRPPANSNHESDAPNRWHLLLLVAAALLCRGQIRYSLGIALAFLLFCFYLKWMPWITRLHLPLFVLGSPIAGFAGEKLRPALLQVVVCLFLFNNSRPYLFENWMRPLRGPAAVWKAPRTENYFADMKQWDNRETYFGSVELLVSSGCKTIGIDINHIQLEYPLQALLLNRDRHVRFVHVGVANASSRYDRKIPPCAVACLDCAGDQGKVQQYSGIGSPVPVNRFLVFLPR